MTDILLIEDNVDISSLLRDFLLRAGYTCHVAESGEAGLVFLFENTVRLVLLDIMLPGMDGFAVCREITQKQNQPIIILSAATEKDDKLKGLILGADDYIEKPYDVDLLLAKINALYRRQYDPAAKGAVQTEGDLVIDTMAHTVTKRGKPISLTIKEYDLLLYLIENKGKALHKETIFRKVWGADSFSEPSTLTVHIKWLREKIENDPKRPTHIQTVWGVGYRFV